MPITAINAKLMTPEDQLNKFRTSYPGTRMTQYDNYLVYSVTPGYSERAAIRANSLIEELSLDLIAEPKRHFPQDSFIIKFANNEK